MVTLQRHLVNEQKSSHSGARDNPSATGTLKGIKYFMVRQEKP